MQIRITVPRVKKEILSYSDRFSSDKITKVIFVWSQQDVKILLTP